MIKKKRLGRGLEALLGTGSENTPSWPGPRNDETPDVAATPQEGLLRLNVHDIGENPFQPRRDFNDSEIAHLAESLKHHDILQPILVRLVASGYQLISGERRLRAAIKAGWSTIPATVREADDRMVAELAIVENLERKDLNPVEKGLSFRRYIEEHQCTQEDLAKRLNVDRSTIANLMRLLELPAPVQERLQKGDLSAGHARALLPLGDEPMQIEFARRITDQGLSVRDTERMVSEQIQSDEATTIPFQRPSTRKTRDHNVESLERELKLALGTQVQIKTGRSGKGSIVIRFGNHDEFQRIFDGLCGQEGLGKTG